MKIEIKILNKKFYSDDNTGGFTPEGYPINLPSYATSGSAAVDLFCTEDVTVYPGETKAIHTGLAIWIGSPGRIQIAGLILPRSGLGTKGLILANTVGLIDEDYQGELIVQAWNRNQELKFIDNVHCKDTRPIQLKAGDRFAQLMFVPVIKAQWEIVDDFSSKTDRGVGGFGSTNK